MKKPRFIAGAICPKCGAEDRIVVAGSTRECVACGFQEERPSSRAKATKPFDLLGTPVQSLRFDDSKPDKNKK